MTEGGVPTISGTITLGGSSSPLPEIQVKLYKYDAARDRWKVVAVTATNDQGYYAFEGLSPGNYRVEPGSNKHTFSPEPPVEVMLTEENPWRDDIDFTATAKSPKSTGHSPARYERETDF